MPTDLLIPASDGFPLAGPRDLGVRRVGHFGYFREAMREPLWIAAAAWLHEQSVSA